MRVLRFKISRKVLTWLKGLAAIALLLLIGWLTIGYFREIDWQELREALAGYDLAKLGIAFLIAIPGQLACASYDLIGRHATGTRLPVLRVMLISFTGYYFSLNIGGFIGGVALRSRLYQPYGFSAATISQIIGLSILTNWSGFVLVAGVILAFVPPVLPADWTPGVVWVRGTGVIFLAIAAGYVLLSAFKGGMRFQINDGEFSLPTSKVVASQLALSLLSWSTIGALLVWLIGGEVTWFMVMPALIVSAIAVLWSHVPGGLGVSEAVFLMLLSQYSTGSKLLAAMLVFRAVYYVAPFVAAVLAYFFLEATAKSFVTGDPSR